MDGARSTHEDENCMQLENLQTREHLENLCIGASVILKRNLNKCGASCRCSRMGSNGGVL